jgi:hypothetical protein
LGITKVTPTAVVTVPPSEAVRASTMTDAVTIRGGMEISGNAPGNGEERTNSLRAEKDLGKGIRDLRGVDSLDRRSVPAAGILTKPITSRVN